jgi:hypothetical protein
VNSAPALTMVNGVKVGPGAHWSAAGRGPHGCHVGQSPTGATPACPNGGNVAGEPRVPSVMHQIARGVALSETDAGPHRVRWLVLPEVHRNDDGDHGGGRRRSGEVASDGSVH